MPEVSVILPYFKAGNSLCDAVESILSQKCIPFELLLFNNNSTDQSFFIAQFFAQKDSRVLLLDETNQGVDHAMNCGLEHARGRFIA
jgi:glycosyltransferase involved in cell wall biosynthesis